MLFGDPHWRMQGSGAKEAVGSLQVLLIHRCASGEKFGRGGQTSKALRMTKQFGGIARASIELGSREIK
jgi:hypothetical protein